MKKLIELTQEELKEVIKNSNMKNKVIDEIEYDIMFWIKEKIDTIRTHLYNWSFEIYGYNHMEMKDVFSGIEEYKKTFGISENLENLLKNNFDDIEHIENTFFQEEFLDEIDYLKDIKDNEIFERFMEYIGLERFDDIYLKNGLLVEITEKIL